MSINRIRARSLCTDSEFTLFMASLSEEIKELTPGELHRNIQRTRELRDMYRSLYARLRLVNRDAIGSKRREQLAINMHTQAKAIMFDEALGRFESRATVLAVSGRRRPRSIKAREIAPMQPTSQRTGA